PFVELAVDQALLAAVQAPQVFANAVLAGVDPVDTDLDRAVVGEQVGRLAPQPAVDVEPERALQLLDRARALELFDAGGQRVDLGLDALPVRRRGQRQSGEVN